MRSDTVVLSRYGCIVRTYLVAVALILVVAGALKLASVASEAPILKLGYPLLPRVSNRAAMLVIGITECLIGYAIIKTRSEVLALVMAFWTGMVFFAFQLFRYYANIVQPCSCLGFVGDWLGVSQHSLDQALLLSRCFITFPSCALIAWKLSAKRLTAAHEA